MCKTPPGQYEQLYHDERQPRQFPNRAKQKMLAGVEAVDALHLMCLLVAPVGLRSQQVDETPLFSKWMKPLCFQSRTIRVSRFTLALAQRCTGIYLPGEA